MSPVAVIVAVGVMLIIGGISIGVGASLGYGAARARKPVRVRARLTRRQLIAGAIALGVFVVSGWLLAAITAGVAALMIPDLWSDKRGLQVITRLDALSTWTRRLADLLASGAANSLEAALIRSAGMCPPEIEPEVRRLADRLRPRGTEAALLAFADEIDDPAGDHIAAAMILRHRSGGQGLAPLLADLAADIETQVANRRAIEADRAKPMSNVRMIISLTIVMSAVMIFFGGDYMAPFRTLYGQVFLALPMGLLLASLGWIRDLTKAQVGPRFLTDRDLGTRPQTGATPAAGRATTTVGAR